MLETLVAKAGVGDWEEKAKLLGTGRTAKSLASKWFGWGRLGTRSTVAENKKPQHDKKKTAAKKGSDDSLTSHTETDSEEDSDDDSKEESEEEEVDDNALVGKLEGMFVDLSAGGLLQLYRSSKGVYYNDPEQGRRRYLTKQQWIADNSGNRLFKGPESLDAQHAGGGGAGGGGGGQ